MFSAGSGSFSGLVDTCSSHNQKPKLLPQVWQNVGSGMFGLT